MPVVTEKECSKCGKIKPLSDFPKNRTKKYGVDNACKSCKKIASKRWRDNNKDYMKEYGKKWREENKEHVARKKREWRENNRERDYQRHREWRKNNPDKVAAQKANRRALKHALPYSTSSELWLDIIMEYNGKCAITGKDRFDLEHMIPLSWGWGGSLKDNIYPMESSLNYQKSNKNPFKFLKQLKGQQRVNFEQVLRNLAKENGLTYKEYKKFVYWCEKHQRTLEEVIEDNKLGLSQVELWKIRSENTPN